MEKFKNEKLKINFEESGKYRHLVLSADANEKVYNYQIDMINSNVMKNINGFQMIRKDGRIYFSYDITSKISLSQFLNKTQLKRNEFLKILISVTDIICCCNSYLLSEKCLLLDEENIFINFENMEISMIYIPVDLGHNLTQELKDMVSRLIMSAVRIKDNSCDNFIQRILEKTIDDTFNIPEFNKFLGDLSGMKIEKAKDEVQKISEKFEEQKIDMESLQNYPEADSKTPKKRPKKVFENKIIGNKTGQLFVVYIILFQILIIGIPLFLYLYGALNFLKKDITVIIVLCMILISIDFLGTRKILIFSKKIGKAKLEERLPKNRVPKKLVQIERIIKDTEDKNEKNNIVFCENDYKNDGVNNIISHDSSNDTVFLAPIKTNFPCLRSTNDNEQKEILITKEKFTIGRLTGEVDFCLKNTSIGRHHAEITQKEGKYFLRDINSKNGSYINNDRLLSGMEYLISDNDKVSFANCEFVFSMG
ncbi:MAG: DUF6382 domain-containing protein [Clostridia bacterium]|jgi:hypothetical protein